MQITKTIKEIRTFRNSIQGTVGFVPTMGYLHKGHLSLIQLAKQENDHVIVSIFVNPKQFGPKEDFQTYPRDIKRDVALLRESKVNIIFSPSVDELYPSNYQTYVHVEKITKKLEGKSRPGHFIGVTTVVTKLFNIIQPTRVYFGQKDAQQVIVIKKMVKDLNIPIEVIIGETFREADGLAMSSRNVFLTDKERKEAGIIYKSLCLAKELFENGERNTIKIKNKMKNLIHATSGKIDYISIADTQTLKELAKIKTEALVSLAIHFGNTRLIDNVYLKKQTTII
ncbi:MAG TPA: pantoate--beta-alanine ligase [Candidatus Saccharimonadales bacterium]|nr:pantoate--beta-alanine ligase [Candidatus Saccharimonadales bacterium]